MAPLPTVLLLTCSGCRTSWLVLATGHPLSTLCPVCWRGPWTVDVAWSAAAAPWSAVLG
jgi:hypothetical protein